MEDIVIVAAARTAVGKFGGSLAKTPAPELGAVVIAFDAVKTGAGKLRLEQRRSWEDAKEKPADTFTVSFEVIKK